MSKSQADRILANLRWQNLCSMEPLRWSPPITRVAARIHELRERGHLIETVNCPEHRGESNHAYYRYKGATQL